MVYHEHHSAPTRAAAFLAEAGEVVGRLWLCFHGVVTTEGMMTGALSLDMRERLIRNANTHFEPDECRNYFAVAGCDAYDRA